MLAVSFIILMLASGVLSRPAAACSGLRLGIGIGMGTRVIWFWMKTMGNTPLVGSKAEIERLDIGMGVHVDAERRLQRADFDLRPEVGDVGQRHLARLDVEHYADPAICWM